MELGCSETQILPDESIILFTAILLYCYPSTRFHAQITQAPDPFFGSVTYQIK